MFFNNKEKNTLKQAKNLLQKINDLEKSMIIKTNNELSQIIQNVKQEIHINNIKYNTNSDFYKTSVVKVFAAIRELSKRIRNERPFDAQIIGALCLNTISIIEMQTGQGKTLVAVISASYRSLYGKVHIITVNDYLAERDYQQNLELYSAIGITISCVTDTNTFEEKIKLYNQFNIIYISINSLCFDYLRSNMQYDENKIMIQEHDLQHVIIDEVDSVLLDNGSTPIIISTKSQYHTDDPIIMACKIVNNLNVTDIVIDEEQQDVYVRESSINFLNELISKETKIPIQDLYSHQNINIFFYIDRQLRAKFLLRKNYEYIVNKSKIQLVDKYTGRVSPDKQYSFGLHQAVEIKEKLKITPETISITYITTQNLFKLYKYISGMTGTAHTDEKEFRIVYNINTIRIPKEEDNFVKTSKEKFFASKENKYQYIVKIILERQKTRQPILVGTSNINESEAISNILKEHNITHHVLNAKHMLQEAEIIEQAGEPGQITIATNMAGRGTDIKLGGNPNANYMKKIKDIENITEEHKLKIKEQIFAEHEEKRNIAYKAGGLLVIITQRQENRRVDRQFKGRTGRRNDNGEVLFLCSIEDEIFKSAKYAKMCSILINNKKEGIESKLLEIMVSMLQRQQEGQLFDYRISTLTKDYAMHRCRTAFFKIRNIILNNKINYKKTIFKILEKLKHLHEINKIEFYKQVFQCCNLEIDENINSNALIDYLNMSIEKITNSSLIEKHYYNIKYRVLHNLDELWSQFINSSNIMTKAQIFVNKIDPILEYNKNLLELFESIFNNYENYILESILFTIRI
ncbi:Protein translocase subunit SecA [bacterium AB1]|nr:Protein translocase subunit SecA [bacterium AB1]